MIANIGVSAAGHYGLRKQGLSPAATICRPGHVLSAQIDALNHPAATTDTHVSDRQAIFEAPFPTPQFAVVRQSPLRLLGVKGMRWVSKGCVGSWTTKNIQLTRPRPLGSALVLLAAAVPSSV